MNGVLYLCILVRLLLHIVSMLAVADESVTQIFVFSMR